jgi:mannitol-specific phosphotransferase system IIBC component
VRWVGLLIGMAVSLAVVAQEAPKKKRKPAAKEQSAKQQSAKQQSAKQQSAKQQSAKQVRGKPTPEQIRKFNELQKKK